MLAIAVIAYLFSGTGSKGSVPLLDNNFSVGSVMVSSQAANATFFVYVARTESQLEQGYMNSTSLGDCDSHASKCLGMLFVFPSEQNECFWMKNTIIPLKQVWINSSFEAEYIYNATTPESTAVICHSGTYILETSPSQPVYLGERIALQG